MRDKGRGIGAWFVATGVLGAGLGLFAERRPFGEGMFAHPLIVLLALGLAALIGLRVVHARPVTDVISERMLLAGVAIGLAAFLSGNFLGVHMLGIR